MRKIFLVLLFLFTTQVVNAQEVHTLKIQPGPDEGKDTYYGVASVGGQDGRPDANHVRIGGWGDEWFAFIEFDFSVLPADASVVSADLHLYSGASNSNENLAKVFMVLDDWEENEPSSLNRPAYFDLGTTYHPVPNADWLKLNVHNFITVWSEGLHENNGFMVRGMYTDNNNVKYFYSSDYLEDPSLRPYLEISYTLPDEEEVDPLIVQYAPDLAFHENEDYFPMSTEEFVVASALWSKEGIDTQLYDVAELTLETFEDVTKNESTEEYYLAFSDPGAAKSYDLTSAKATYQSLDAAPVVYYHRVDDAQYTVLQYWYFYAMNNWKEHGGFNDHEGDWESVFIYLNKDTLEPMYIAYSAHHNDGTPSGNLTQYDSVRRGWGSDDVVRSGDTVTSFVSLGSHANYPNNNEGVHDTGWKDDITSANGEVIQTTDYAMVSINADDPFWMQYEGLWGTDTIGEVGGDAPQGPAFSGVGTHVRFSEPVEWAGIDRIKKFRTERGRRGYAADRAGVSMQFKSDPQENKEILIEPYSEWISLGEKPEGVTLLPNFWDITSELENGSFEADITFSYDPSKVEELGGRQGTLGVYYYNEPAGQWERQSSLVNEEDATVTFTASHFSRYALGFVDERLYNESLFVLLKTQIDETGLRSHMKRYLKNKVDFLERSLSRDLKQTSRIATHLLGRFTHMLGLYQKHEYLTLDELAALQRTTEKIENLLDS